MDLDFSELSDDQLVGLIRAACAEAVRRGTAVESAARDAYLSEAERAQVARVAAEETAERLRRQEAERIAKEIADRAAREVQQKAIESAADKERRLWAAKKGVAEALVAAGWDVKGDQLVVWLSASKEKRVFLQKAGYGSGTYATLYVTGNAKKAPDHCDLDRGMDKSLRAEIPKILRAVAQGWAQVKIDLHAALAWNGDAIPLAGYQPLAVEKAS